MQINKVFLSTPSARRATKVLDAADNIKQFLSTPSARRATELKDLIKGAVKISIHALREEGDVVTSAGSSLEPIFLSTPSARRATAYVHNIKVI